MPDDLYTADILVWSDRQAALLRRLARGERVNDAIDWDNVIEEIESVGRSELAAVRSLLLRALEHVIKLHAAPAGPAAHWRHEVVVFLQDARARYAPSMRQALDIQALWDDARDRTGDDPDLPSHALPAAVPFTLEDLLPDSGRPAGARADALLARLSQGD